MVGTYHKVSKDYLPLYLNEFSYRHNNRDNPDVFADLITTCSQYRASIEGRKMKPSKKRKPISAKQRESDEQLRDQLRNFDLKTFDKALVKAIRTPAR